MTRSALVVPCAVLLCIGALGGTAMAGDNVALVYFDPAETAADPGETVEVEAVMRTHGGYGGEGIASVNKTIAYDPEVLTVLAVDRGPWLEGGNETDIVVETAVDGEEGRVTVEQVRSPIDGGAKGYDATVVLRFEVAEDAPPSNAALQYAETNVTLENGVPQHVVDRDGLVVIDGGGDERRPLADDDDDDTPAITTPDATPTPMPTPTPPDTDPSSDDVDDQGGFGFLPAIGALVGLALLGRLAGVTSTDP